MGSWRPAGWEQAQEGGYPSFGGSHAAANGALPVNQPQSSVGTWAVGQSGMGTATGLRPQHHSGPPSLAWQPAAYFPAPYHPGSAPLVPLANQAAHFKVAPHPPAEAWRQPMTAPPLLQPPSTPLAPRPYPIDQPKGLPVSPVAYPAGGGIAPLVKNAISLLNEACQKSKLGTPHYHYSLNPATAIHTTVLTLCGRTFMGTGPSRPVAKNAAAKAALDGIPELGVPVPVQSVAKPVPAAAKAAPAPKDPMSALNELCQKRSLSAAFTFTENSGDRWVGPTHTASLTIAGRSFVASAPRKDVAKKLAARAALEELQGPGAQPTDPIVSKAPTAGLTVTPQEIAALAQLLPGVRATEGGGGAQEPPVAGAPAEASTGPKIDQPKEGAKESAAAPVAAADLPPTQAESPQAPSPLTPREGQVAGRLSTAPVPEGVSASKQSGASVARTGKDPVSLLNEYTMSRGAHFDLAVRRLSSVPPTFLAEYTLDGKTFSAEGLSKGEAKRDVAEAALQYIEGQYPGKLQGLREGNPKKARKARDAAQAEGEGISGLGGDGGARKRKAGEVQQNGEGAEGGEGFLLAHRLARLACSKYQQLAAGRAAQQGKKTALFRPGAGTPPVPSAQVLAAVLLETPSATGNSTLRVVALATGAHHAPLPRQDDGALRDCRAEVLALRAFRRFLCSQLQQALQREAQETHPEISLSSGPGPGSVTDDRMESNETGGAADAEAGPSSNAALGGEGAQAAVTDGAMTSGSGGLLSNGVEESRAAKRAKVDGAEEGSAGQLPVPVLEAAALGQESGDAALTALTAVTEAAEGGTSVEGPGALDGVEVAADSGVAEGEAVVRGEDGQWRLREGAKVHLWVSTPMARRGNGGAANDGERQSRRAKVLRWSAVGVQGALLSHVLPPVYLASVTVNVDEELYQTEPALAGLAKRLPLPFAVTQPDVVQAYSFVKGTIEVEAGTPMTECGESWALGDEGLETLRQADGKREDGGEPRLSRRQIFEQFRKLQGSSTQSRCLESTDDTTGQQPGAPSFESVEAAKRAAVRYQAAKEVLSEFLMERSRAESCAGNGIVALDVAKPTTAT